VLALLLVGAAWADPAAGAIVRRRVVDCRPANPTCWPAAFDFAPDGRIFYAERLTGQIRVFDPSRGTDRLWRRIGNVATAGEQGVLGLALDPRWPERRWVYVYYTREGSPDVNRIVRIRRRAGGTFMVRELTRVPANVNHNGGVIHFGPDGLLYAVTGDAGSPALAQDTGSRAGKVLRMRPGGGVPEDNPFGNRVYSFGHRNSFGFAFDPRTGRLWQTENGPQCNDEVNRIRRGRNYGWGPHSSCPSTNASGPDPVAPAHTYRRVIAPTGAAFCQGCRLGPSNSGQLLVGAWNDGRIRRLRLTADRRGVESSRVIFDGDSGILAVEAGPRGVYFSTPDGIFLLRRA
jgi:glucose/arabinose dehydrogenase